MKKVAVIGATGYTGQELIRLLLQHEQVEIHSAVSHSNAGKKLASVYPNFVQTSDLVCRADDIAAVAEQVDVIFLALPHGMAAKMVTEEIISKCPVIDMGGDFRLKQADQYEQWYGLEHPNAQLLTKSVYGLPEHNREQIKNARLIANPGCYATCSILTIAPLLKAGAIKPDSIVIDAKSGVTGAGRGLALGVHFDECNESIKAYKIAEHRHVPEIEQALKMHAGSDDAIAFTPHLVPMNRGILVTAYASLANKLTEYDLYDIYKDAYENETFIRLFGPWGVNSNAPGEKPLTVKDSSASEYRYPETRWVKGSNYCDIGATVDHRTKRVVAVGAIDNLVKGAAGQAIQNMNLLFGWPESLGLTQAPIFAA